jgi:CheY-like chemotaxis protein
VIALVGIENEPSFAFGGNGQLISRIPHALKPSQLRDAIRRVCAPPDSSLSPSASSEIQPAPSTRGSSMPLRILIAEDNAVNQMLLQLQVESLGHRAQVVASGIEAIQAIKIDSFDVVLMDIEMPEMDGIETSRAIRDNPETARMQLYIVAVTAHATHDMRIRLQNAGMDDFVPKPVLREALVLALERAIVQRRRHAQA